jgi:hypothetical protein
MAEPVCGVTLEQIVRKGILVLMVVGFAIAFAYDGYVRYPQKNLDEALRSLDPPPKARPPIHPGITSEATRGIADGEIRRLQDVVDRFGPPGWKRTDGLTTEHIYFGPAYVMKLTTTSGVITGKEFSESAYKDESAIYMQKVFAAGLMVLAVPIVLHYIWVLAYRVCVTGQGLKVTGRPFIPFERMRSIDASRYKDKGWIDLFYRLDGKERTLRLDEYWIREFKPVMTEICHNTGIGNPLEDTAADPAEEPETPHTPDTPPHQAEDRPKAEGQ